jgi:Co/Zn/Cd efflux system component
MSDFGSDDVAVVIHERHGSVAWNGCRRRLLLSLIVTSTFFVVELVGGLLSGSLTLLADACHMFTDVGRGDPRVRSHKPG